MNTPLSPKRERMTRIWHEELARLSDPTAVARRTALGELLGEIDRLRAERSETNAALDEAVAEIQAKSERIAALEARLFQVGSARTYKLESGKKFLYVEDIAEAVLGRATPDGAE